VFALVLALKLVPAIKPHYLTDIPLAITLYDSRHKTRIPESAVPKVCLCLALRGRKGSQFADARFVGGTR
jgi:hypothetical protein